MKKLILPLLLLLAISMLVAVESDPSAVVGYFKKTVADGAYQAIALPFAYGSLTVDAVMGAQYLDNDAVQNINSGVATTFILDYGFDGELTDMTYGDGYFLNRAAGNGAGTYYLLGKVDPQAFTVTIWGNGAFTAFGLSESAPIAILAEDHPFGIHPTDGDVVQEIDTGFSSTFIDGYGWDGELVEISPTFAYYYNSASGTSNFSWTYTPTRGRTVQTPMSSNRKTK